MWSKADLNIIFLLKYIKYCFVLLQISYFKRNGTTYIFNLPKMMRLRKSTLHIKLPAQGFTEA